MPGAAQGEPGGGCVSDERVCGACGQPLVRKAGETAGNWKRRKFCDRTCMAAGFRAEEPGEDALLNGGRDRVKNAIPIDIKHKRVRGGRLAISSGTTNKAVAAARTASVRKLLDRGDLDVIEALRTRKLHIAEVDAAVRDGEYGRLKIVAAAPADPVGVAVRKYLRSVKATTEPGTLKAYAGLCRALERRFGRRLSVDAIDEQQAQDFLHGPQAKGKPWSARSQRQASQVYRRVWAAGRAKGQPWERVKLPRKRKVRVTFLKPQEWHALAERHRGLPDLAPLALGTLAGLRLSEIIHLRTDVDVDLAQRVIHIQPRTGEFAWKPKTDNSIRDIPICDELHAILTAHVRDGYAGARYLVRTADEDRPVSASYLAGRVQKACERVGIRWGMKGDGITTHSLRHTFASWLAQRDVQLLKVAQLMGDTVEVVAGFYAHLLPGDLDKAVALLDEIVRAP